MPLSPGDQVAGYKIESVVARGGMGVVYRARHAELGRSVALKVIAADRAGDETFRKRFVREARLAASLDHPNVIPVFEAGDDDGLLFIAMRLVEGSDLERLIAADGPLAPALAVRLIEQAAAGLDAAHARGLVHRDIKPANILLAGPPADPHVYVTDFGVATSLAPNRPLTLASEWVGTAGYAAPEQTQGGAVDARADVYALGCVLFAALHGRPPFTHGPGGGGPLDQVVARALSRRPDDRYDSAGDLAAAARAALPEAEVA
ncbi:MAG: serine/threonine-protein kinase, partial [Solirubrobacteraceae bacterium]